MTRSYFGPGNYNERCMALRRELESWRGTPFLHRGRVKGCGVDCVNLVAQVMLTMDVVTTYDFGDYYPLDWGQHRERSLILEYIVGTERFTRLEGERGQLGDIVCFQVGKCVQHCGIIGVDGFWHVIHRGSVCVNLLIDPTWSKRLHSIWRPLP
jgi:cell wall-associated NlpC family hydrolase